MTKEVRATCDKCGEVFSVQFEVKHHPNKVQETYFNCENCFHRFTSFVTDTKIRKLQRKRDSLIGLHNLSKRLKLQAEINERMNQLKHNLINFGRADL